ncbi:TrmA family RNA methyltransferase [Candidatus Kinetoplastibacterium desouzaii TCC079E]|uniref:TrmA family RNA methyltransferase n=1 Tax=Candidatus Kinetoplastidibacterium desouzai TCC079E TaxID=1208919 RepID=M1LU57_9PROT|nr:23S rRNA (uracil(1939)-C(5))-methyltransferase RlmD [Candidatus Kinetoplastibacterium desouzaii]AGF46824.1 TrmA family RNA methyltransferase [Candidatus Kinetoplastibacterium desouzaii TCC079E]
MSDILEVESMDLEARGISHNNGKVVFINGALTGEKVVVDILKSKKSYDVAKVRDILVKSIYRVDPPCKYFGVCGACSMQHLDYKTQIAIKQRVLEDSILHIGKTRPDFISYSIHGYILKYRYRARFSIKFLIENYSVFIGFNELNSNNIADINSCLVLHDKISELIVFLRELISSLSIVSNVLNIEVSMGDNLIVHLIISYLGVLSNNDKILLQFFEKKHNVKWWLRQNSSHAICQLNETNEVELYYSIPEFNLLINYHPSDFTQVNHDINRIMISKVVSLLDVKPFDKVLDLFCGLGNFTLPLARVSSKVLGVDVNHLLISRACKMSVYFKLNNVVSFMTANLFNINVSWFLRIGFFDLVVLDPPRDGAFAVSKALSLLPKKQSPRRIIYVSCNPATLARDVNVLVSNGKYTIRSSGIINMFSHTSHIESITVLEL